jgi:hypothetical protein
MELSGKKMALNMNSIASAMLSSRQIALQKKPLINFSK